MSRFVNWMINTPAIYGLMKVGVLVGARNSEICGSPLHL